jgi:hypothetical protein
MNMVDFDQKYDIHWVAQTEKKNAGNHGRQLWAFLSVSMNVASIQVWEKHG